MTTCSAEFDAGHQLDFIADAFAGFHQPQMGTIISDYESQLHLATLNDSGDRHAKYRGCRSPVLLRVQTARSAALRTGADRASRQTCDCSDHPPAQSH